MLTTYEDVLTRARAGALAYSDLPILLAKIDELQTALQGQPAPTTIIEATAQPAPPASVPASEPVDNDAIKAQIEQLLARLKD